MTSISLIYSLTYSRKKELLFWLSRGLKRLTCYALVSGQGWARKFVTFQLVSVISRNETGLLRDILRSLRVWSFNLLDE